jgi:hypothetical protein
VLNRPLRSRPLALVGVALALVLGASPPPSASAQPEVFSRVRLLDAKARAEQEGKILLVVAVREDCAECPGMVEGVFRNPRVLAWLEANAVCFHFDADDEPGEALRFQPGPFPTTIVIRDGHEIDRITAPMNPNEFLRFVTKAAAGRGRVERLVHEYRVVLRSGFDRNAQVRYEWANTLLDAKADEVATEEFLFLWNNILDLDPNAAATRHKFMPEKIKTLCARYVPAREAFTALRDELTPSVDPTANEAIDTDDLLDWIVLNSIVRDFDRTVAWAQNVVDHHDRALLEQGGAFLFDTLVFRFSWRLAGLVYEDPMDFIELHAAAWGDRLGSSPVIDSYHLENFGDMYAALLAAERYDEAVRVANAAFDFKYDAITERRLIYKAQLAGIDESLHRIWKSAGPAAPTE